MCVCESVCLWGPTVQLVHYSAVLMLGMYTIQTPLLWIFLFLTFTLSLSARNAAYVEEPAAFALTWKTHDLNVAHGIKDVGDCEASKIVSKL